MDFQNYNCLFCYGLALGLEATCFTTRRVEAASKRIFLALGTEKHAVSALI